MIIKRFLHFIDIRKNISRKLILSYVLLLMPALIIPGFLYYLKSTETIEKILTQNMYRMSDLIRLKY